MIDTEKFIKDLVGFAKDPILLNPLMSALDCQGLEVQSGYIVPKLILGCKVRNVRLGIFGEVVGLAYEHGWISIHTERFNPPIQTVNISELSEWEVFPMEKFKVGDTVRLKRNHTPVFTIDAIVDGSYQLNGAEVFNICNQDNWEKIIKPAYKKDERVLWDGEEYKILDVDEENQTYNIGGYIVAFERENELSLATKFRIGDVIRFKGQTNTYTIKEVQRWHYVDELGRRMDMSYTDANFEIVPKFCVGDFVKHCSNPEIIYRVAKVFEDGTYRIEPTNADMGNAITSATEDCMTLISSCDNGEFENAIKTISGKVLATDQHVKNTANWILSLARKKITEGVDIERLTKEWTDTKLINGDYGVCDAYKQGMMDLLKIFKSE